MSADDRDGGKPSLCAKCRLARKACVTGNCQGCGDGTTYRAHKLCDDCAAKRGVCAMCLAPLQPPKGD